MKRIGALVFGCALLAAMPIVAQSRGDKEFIAKSSQGNVTEVEMAKLALKKSSNPQVRAFAEKMIHDHTMLGKEMAPFAAAAGVQTSVSLNGEHQRLYNRLNGLSGTAFDRAYVEAMDKDHHQDLQEFQKEVATTQDHPLKVEVEKGEQVIRQHVEIIDGIARKMGIQPA